jgi:hypothetical protein
MVDAILKGSLEQLLIDLVSLLLRVDHISKGNNGSPEAGVTEVAVEHLTLLEQ